MEQSSEEREWKGDGGRWVRLNPEYRRDGKAVNTVAYSTGTATFADSYKHRPEAEARYESLVRAYKENTND